MRVFRMWRTNTDERGFTLIEFSVAMTVFLIFMSLATPFMFRNLQQALDTENRADLQQNARSALRTLVRELRQAEELYVSADKPSGKNRISFGVDFDGDGVINSYNDLSKPLEQITYYTSSDTLFRGRKQGQGALLAEDVTNISFTMFGSNIVLDTDGDGIVTEDELNKNGDKDGGGNVIWQAGELANVTRIAISMTVSANGDTQTYTADAWLRNKVVG